MHHIHKENMRLKSMQTRSSSDFDALEEVSSTSISEDSLQKCSSFEKNLSHAVLSGKQPQREIASTDSSLKPTLGASTKENEETLIVENNAPKSGKKFTVVKIALKLLIALPVFITLVLFYQGISCLMDYRKFFGKDAPIPFSPSHGVVAAIDKSLLSSTETKLEDFDGESDFFIKKFSESNTDLDHTKGKAPVRLLLLGDSIARGVGQMTSCYPLLPETFGAILSKHHGGAPVYWSAFGEPGATTKWLASKVREESVLQTKSFTLDEFHSFHELKEIRGSRNPKIQWTKNLEYHRMLHEANSFAGYDYIVALSGVNDIKGVLVPFLVTDDASSKSVLHEDDEVEWGFKGDLTRLVKGLNATGSLLDDDEKEVKNCNRKPFILLPSFPTKHVPVKVGLILRWIAVRSTGLLDSFKKQIANKYENVEIVPIADDKITQDFIDGVTKPGSLRDMLYEEEILVQISDKGKSQCEGKARDMSNFYNSRGRAKHEENMTFSSLFSHDAVHPNDVGYDYFGRYIGKELLKIMDQRL